MTTVAYNSVELNNLIGTFTGGLAGAPAKLRASQRAKVRTVSFTYQQTAGAGNAGDTVTVARLFQTDLLMDYMINISNTAPGANCLMNIGTRNPSITGTLSNATIDSAVKIAVVGVYRAGQIPINSTNVGATTTFTGPNFQVGTDPLGDDSSGQGPLFFGSAPVDIVLQFYNAGVANNALFAGYLLVATGQ
jgi:hypothetical protein